MKAIQISDELYDKLKSYVVDPFGDTPESVISRLVDIADKAKSKWSAFDAHVGKSEQRAESPNRRSERPEHWKEQVETVL